MGGVLLLLLLITCGLGVGEGACFRPRRRWVRLPVIGVEVLVRAAAEG